MKRDAEAPDPAVQPRRGPSVRRRAPDELRAAIDGLDPETRRRKILGLKVEATRARQRGVLDDDNVALAAIRAAGVPPRRRGLQTLERLGLLEPLRARVRKRTLYTLDLLLEKAGKAPEAVCSADVAAFVAGKRPEIAAVLASQVRQGYDALIALGHASTNPSPSQMPRRPELPDALARELAAIDQLHVRQRAARGTRRESRDLMYRAAEWARAVGVADMGLCDLLWEDEARLEQLAHWWAQPRKDGTLRSVNCMPPLFKLLKRLWCAHGRSITEARDHVRRLTRMLRANQDDFGALDLLDLKSEDPAPAPAKERCEALVRAYAEEVSGLRALGAAAHGDLLETQRKRQLFFILLRVGIRRASLASLRLDQLKRDSDGMWYFDACVTKRTRAPKRVVVQTWRVEDTTFSRWYAPQEFIDMLVEALRDEGYDLEKYLKTREPQHVPWVTARNGTFGPHLDGKPVAAVWRGKRGHLTVGAIASIVARILHERLGMDRGGPHAMRRRSIMNYNARAKDFPQAAEMLQHLTPETRSIYEWSEERSVSHMFPATEPPAPSPEAKPEADRGGSTTQPDPSKPRRARGPRERRISRDDLL